MKNIFLIGEVGWEITYEGLQRTIDFNSKEDLRIFVHSPGGDIWEGFLLYDLFDMYKGKIEFVILGMALSAAGYFIFAGDTISAFKNSNWMGHKVQIGIWGDADRLRIVADIADSQEKALIETFQARLNMSESKLKVALKDELWLVGGEALLKSGVIDNIYEDTDDLNLDGDLLQATEKNLAITIDMQASNARAQYKNVQTKIKERELTPEYGEKMVAFHNLQNKKTLDNVKQKTHVQTQELNNMADTPKNLQELLTANPHVKMELTNFIQSEHTDKLKIETTRIQTESETKLTNAVTAERQRISKILTLENVKLTESAASALEGDTSYEAYMEARLTNQDIVRQKPVTVFGNLVSTDKNPLNTTENKSENYDAETVKLTNQLFPNSKVEVK